MNPHKYFLIFSVIFSILLSSCGGSSDNYNSTPPDAFDEIKEKILQLCPLPQVAKLIIETRNKEDITSKTDYISANLEIQSSNPEIEPPITLIEIRGRGNSTWIMSPKKSYTIKLNKKANLLGMSETKKWSLLANYGDKSMLRTITAFCMARILDMPYTPDSEFIELTINGIDQGLYQLTNKTYKVSEKIKKEREEFSEINNGNRLNDSFFTRNFL